MRISESIDSNPLVIRWLTDRYGYSSVEKWIESTVKNLLDSTNQTAPPIALESIAKKRKISEYPRPHVSAKWEDRFTFAHEIAHTFLYDLSTTPPRRIFPSMSQSISEILCNRIAAEVLMPKWMVKDFLNEYPSMTEKHFNIQIFRKIVLDFMKYFRVSPNVVARRLVENLNLWNILVLGVGWRRKSSEKEAIKLGELRVRDYGFEIRLNKTRRKSELDENGSYAWRVEWYAKPSWGLKELFIPSRGNPRVNLRTVEDLYQSSSEIQCLKNSEQIGAFKIGNLTKHLPKTYGTVKKYPVFACYLKRAKERELLLSNELAKDEDFRTRTILKVVVCIPLKPA